MNFLGHCLFSEPTPSALVGSLMPDFGRRPSIELSSETFNIHFDRHQLIDRITDSHSILEPLRKELRPTFRKTTPIVVDMMLDHHLANHWSSFHRDSLDVFSNNSYQLMSELSEFQLNEQFTKTLHWMTRRNWFVSYKTHRGIMNALEGISSRIRFNNPIPENRHRVPDLTIKYQNELTDFINALNSEINPNN